MVLRKTSSLFKIGIVSASIILVSLFHFQLSKMLDSKQQHLSNAIKLLKTNELILEKTNVLSELFYLNQTNSQNEALAAADLFDYTLSILINGGSISESENIIYLETPDPEKLVKLNEIESSWKTYFKLLEQLSRSPDNEGLLRSLKKNYNSLSSFIEHIQSSYISDYQKKSNTKLIIDIIALIFYTTLSIFLYFFIKAHYVKPIKSVEQVIEDITKGRSVSKHTNLKEDFSPVRSKLDKLYHKSNEISDFVKQLVNDNYEVRFEKYNKKDILEFSLVQLRNKLKTNIELNNKRQEEEKTRQWFADGQAKFNDILRESSSSINLLAETSIKNLVKFFNAAQGGFFVLKEHSESKFLELTSAFAYDRIKSINKIIPMGEGLIGMCALEKNTIWINNVPEDYMEIESGLGEAPPTNILIVPLKTDENTLGVIEIASFSEFSKNEVEFIENIAENIASTLETTKITDKTSVLLDEFQKKSEELAKKDAEITEKIQELKEAQKEAKRSETEMTSLIKAVDSTFFKIELTQRGKISSANQLFIKALKTRQEEVRTKNLFEIIKDKDKALIDTILQKVKTGESIKQTLTFITKNNTKITARTLFSPIKNEKGQIVRILLLANSINDIEELIKENKMLVTETENQKEQLLKIHTDNKNTITEYLRKIESFSKELDTHIEKEKQIKKKYENETDKKYFQWLSSFKS